MTPKLKIKKVKGIGYYVARGYVGGKRKDKSVGRVDSMTVSQAQLAAVRVFEEANHPSKQANQAPTFAEILDQATAEIAASKHWKNARSESQWRQTLHDYALPVLGPIPVDQITVDDVHAALKGIWATNTETAKRTRGRIEKVLSWCKLKKLIPRDAANPAAWADNLDMLLASPSKLKKVKHHERPTIAEVRKLVRYCRLHPSPASALFLFTAATVLRNSEARLMKMSEVHDGVLVVPEERMKSGNGEGNERSGVFVDIESGEEIESGDFYQPLSSLALEALKQASPVGYAFSADKYDASVPLSLDTVRLKIQGIAKRKITLHGIRSTFRDWAARKKLDAVVTEKCLAHKYRDKTTVAYQRDQLIKLKLEILQAWADAIS